MKKDKIVYTYIQGEDIKPFITESEKNRAIKIMIDRKGRNGKSVTIVSGFNKDVDLKSLASELKKITGCGGTFKDGTIEIQGEKKDIINSYLLKKGFKTKVI
ncbi:MAG TPA: translation initiation factor [Spirochaetota bacterium]|nr:translation initiation factor [Spirochaetota bacterium]HOL56361.1 translation initiation factor [Spirochaetota bacterium]HPP03664.1 translation initiation factor [Spirochaetota bacterium]